MIRKLNFAFGTLLVLGFSLALLFCARKERISFVRDDYSPSQGWVKSSYDWFGWYKEGVNYMILPGTERNYHAKFSVKVSKAHSDQLETFDASISDHKVLTFKTTAIYKFISSVVIKSENIPPHVKHYISSLDLLSSQIRDLTDEKGYYVGDLFAKLVVDKDANSSKLLLLDKTDGKQIADAFRFAGIFTSNLALLDYNVLLEYRLYGKTYFMPAKILEDATGLNTFEPMNEESKVLFVHGRFGSIQISYILPDLPVVEKEYSLPGDAVFNKSGGVSLRISQIESTPWADLLGFKGADCDAIKLYIHTQDGLIATDVQVSADGSFPLIIPADIAQTKNIQPGDKIVKAISCDDKRAINLVNITSNTTSTGIVIRPYQGSNGNGSLFQDAKIYDVKVDYTASPDLSGATFSPASKVYIEDFSDTQGRIQIEVPENTKVYLKYVLTASCVNKVVLSGSSVYSIGDNVLDCKDREYFEIKDQLKNITNASAIKVTAEDKRYTKTYDVSIKFIATITDVFEARFDQQGNLSVKTEINRGANEIIVKNINRRTWETNPNGVNGNIYVSPDANVLYRISSVNYAFDSYILEPPGLVVKHQKTIPFADQQSIAKGDIDILHESKILGGIPYKLHFEYLSQDTSLEELIISQVVGTETKTFKATPNALGNLIFTGLYKDEGVNVTSVRHKGVSSSLNAGYNFPDSPATATIKITAEDGTEKTYAISFAYQDNEAYIEKLVLVQRGGNIPGNGKVFSTESLDGEAPRIVIDNESHIITIKNIGKSGKPYLARGSFYIQEIKIEGDESTLSINVNGMLPNTTNLTVKQVNNVLSFASQDGLSTPSYKLQIEDFMGTEAKLSSILFKQTGLGTDYEGKNIPDKPWTLAPTTANLGTVNGVYKSRGIIDTISTTRSDFARAAFLVFEPNQATHTLIRIIPEDEMNPVDYVFTPKYLESCDVLNSVTFTQSQIKNQFNVLLPNRTIGTTVQTTLLANTVTVNNDLTNSLIKGNGTIRIASNANFTVCAGAELRFMGSPAMSGAIDNLEDNVPFDALEVISEDKITSRKYQLIPNYLNTEARLTSIAFKQQLGAPFATSSLTFSETPGVAFQQKVEIDDFNNKIIIKGAYNRSGDISITSLTTSSLKSAVYTPTNVPYVPNVKIITGNNPSAVAGAIVVESEDKVTRKTYQLVFEDLLGNEAKLVKISLEQTFVGLNNALDNSPILNKFWADVFPDANNKLLVIGAIKNRGAIATNNNYYTLSQTTATATVNPAINNPSAEHDIITVKSQDALVTTVYKVAPNYLSDCTGITSIKLIQKGIPYYAGHTSGSTQDDIDVDIVKATANTNFVVSGKQFVQGKGRLVIENPSLCAGASLYLDINGIKIPYASASIDNPTQLNYSDKLLVVSQDGVSEAKYNIQSLNYKNNGTKLASITFDYTNGGTTTSQTINNPTSNSLFVGSLAQGSGILNISANPLAVPTFAVGSEDAAIQQLPGTPTFPNMPVTNVFNANAFHVVSADETEIELYTLNFGYLGEEAYLKSIKLIQKAGTPPNNEMSLGNKNFSTDDGTITISAGKIEVKGVVKRRGKIIIADFDVEGKTPQVDGTNVAENVTELAIHPEDAEHISYKKIVVKSASGLTRREYELNLSFLGSESNIVSWRIQQKTPGNHAITGAVISAKIWNVPSPAPTTIALTDAYRRAAISYDVADLSISNGATIEPGSIFPINNPQPPVGSSNSSHPNAIIIKSQDGYATSRYGLDVTYLSEEALLTGTPTLKQTVGTNSLLDNTSLDKTAQLTIGAPTGDAANLNIAASFGANRFVSGYGSFQLTFVPSLNATTPSGNSPLFLSLDNASGASIINKDDFITVLSEDHRKKTVYSLKSVPFYNNGVKIDDGNNIKFRYNFAPDFVNTLVTGTVNGSNITLTTKLVNGKGTLALDPNSWVLNNTTGVNSSLLADVRLSNNSPQKPILQDQNTCLNCVVVTSQSAVQSRPYTISYNFLSSDVALTSLSFKQGGKTFNSTSGLVLENATANGGTYVLKGVKPNASVQFSTLATANGNTAKYNNNNIVLNTTALTQANAAIPTDLSQLVILSEDKQKSLTYSFRIEYLVNLETISYATAGAGFEKNRIGAGDFTKPDLYAISNWFTGNYAITLTFGGINANVGQNFTSALANLSGTLFSINQYVPILDGDRTLKVEIRTTGTNPVLLATSGDVTVKKEQYLIKTWRDLQGMEYDVTATAKYKLDRDITFPAVNTDGFTGFRPIRGPGTISYNNTTGAFKGELDGNYKKIINLDIRNVGDFVGLFAAVHGAKISNLVFMKPNINAPTSHYVGVLTGQAGIRPNNSPAVTVISNVGVVGGYVNAKGLLGGLIGISRSSSELNRCFYIGSIKTEDGDRTGGLVGELQGFASISDTFMYGEILSGNLTTSAQQMGGLIGTFYVIDGDTSPKILNSFVLVNMSAILALSGNAQKTIGYIQGESVLPGTASSLNASLPASINYNTMNNSLSISNTDVTLTCALSFSRLTGTNSVPGSGLCGTRQVPMATLKAAVGVNGLLNTFNGITAGLWDKEVGLTNNYMGGLPYLKWIRTNAQLTQGELLQVTWQ